MAQAPYEERSEEQIEGAYPMIFRCRDGLWKCISSLMNKGALSWSALPGEKKNFEMNAILDE